MQQRISPERVAAGRARLDEAERVARLAGEHLWIAAVSHIVRDPGAAVRDGLQLDAETLTSADVGCYLCEQLWTPRLATRRCNPRPA